MALTQFGLFYPNNSLSLGTQTVIGYQ